MGKHHIKYYCDYYEFKAKETGEWNPQELIYEITFDKLNKGIPGGSGSEDKVSNNSYTQSTDKRGGDKDVTDNSLKRSADENKGEEDEEEEEEFMLPPPPHLIGLPPPPTAVYNNVKEIQMAIHQNIQR